MFSIGGWNLRTIAREAHKTNKAHGFADGEPDIDQKLLLAVGEIVEAQNELRNGHLPQEVYFEDVEPIPGLARPSPDSLASRGLKPEGFGVEIADAIIRLLGLSEHLGIDIQQMVEWKMNYNDTRPFKHGGKAF